MIRVFDSFVQLLPALRTGSETTFPRLQGVWASTLESSVCLGSLAIMTSTEEQKKAILPFLQRADEIGKVEPKVAYYCRLYAVQQGLGIEGRSPQIEGVLRALVNKLEKEKATIILANDDSQYCENFAITVFTRADKIDRAGRADKNTAMTFYAASIFFEILNQFKNEGLEADLVDMQRYAAWKAADIRKALREGRTPTPGAPGGDAPAASTLTPSGDMGGPSSMSQSQNEADMPPSASLSGASLPSAMDRSANATSRFKAGARVFFDSNGIPVKGTVAKPHATGEGSEYMVALSDRIVTASEASLAPDLEVGDTAMYEPQRGEMAEVTIASIDIATWPPSYIISLQNGAQMPALYSHLTLLQQASRSGQQSMDQQQFQEAKTAGASPGGSDINSTRAAASASSRPPSSGGASYSSAGESQARPSGRSDMSQALLLNTAALESNLAAAQRGDAIEFSDAGSSDTVDADLGTSQVISGPEPTTTPTVSGLPSPQPQARPPPPLTQSRTQMQSLQLPQASVEIPRATPGFQPSLSAISEAQKQAKYAASSLGFEDVHTAVKQLTDALKLLTQPGAASSSVNR